ncbi:MAG: hypothetical protein ACR2H3_11880, partial [Acidimicrobiales bacterium]
LDDKDPVVVSEAVHRIMSDDILRRELISRGRERVAASSLASTSARLLDVITTHVGPSGG